MGLSDDLSPFKRERDVDSCQSAPSQMLSILILPFDTDDLFLGPRESTQDSRGTVLTCFCPNVCPFWTRSVQVGVIGLKELPDNLSDPRLERQPWYDCRLVLHVLEDQIREPRRGREIVSLGPSLSTIPQYVVFCAAERR